MCNIKLSFKIKQALNKRHQKRASKAFEMIMSQKEEGALKGLKTTNKKVK